MRTSRWPHVPLGELLQKRAEWVDLDPDLTYRQVTVRLWGAGVSLRRSVKGLAIAATSQLKVRAGQFILSRIDARSGAFGIVPSELDGAVVSQDFPVYETHRERLLPEFLGWISKTDWFVDLCRGSSEGSTNRVRLKEDRFLAHSIPLPPILDQRRIISLLEKTASCIVDRTRAANEVEAELTKALRVAFHKVTSEAPKLTMQEIAPLVRRSVEVSPEMSYSELGVRSFGKGTFHKPDLPGFEVGTKRLFRIEKGDLLFNIVFAWEGAVAVAKDEDDGRVGSHRFLTCVPDPDRATPEFLRYFFLTEEGLQRLGEASPGGAGRNRTLGIQALDAIQVPCPSLDAQRWFNALQAKAAVARANSEEAAAELKRLIPAILDQAF
jgi:type I restriction enzyme, S subunit